MKSIVIYNSQTGFTKQYAEWISQEAGCECVSLRKAAKINLSDYDSVVFGSWCMAGSLTKLDWFKKKIPSLSKAGKKLIVFAVGASPSESLKCRPPLKKCFLKTRRKLQNFSTVRVVSTMKK